MRRKQNKIRKEKTIEEKKGEEKEKGREEIMSKRCTTKVVM